MIVLYSITLLFSIDIENLNLSCPTCTYSLPIPHRIVQHHTFPISNRKQDDILGGADAWKNVDQTETTCPSCRFEKAYFMQVQTRSADEPMTTFFKCVKCGHRWKEG